MKQRKSRSKFNTGFKKKSAAMTTSEDVSLTSVAESLGIPAQYLSKWRTDYLVDGKVVEAEKKLVALEENCRLKDENKRLKMVVDILRKAASYFASHRQDAIRW